MTVTGETISSKVTANQSVTNSTVLVDATNLIYAAPANRSFHFRLFVPFTLAGAASGYKFQLVTPAVTTLWTSYLIFSNVSTLIDSKNQNASAAIAGAAAAGDYVLLIEGVVQPSAAGNVKLQFAQNVADAAAITINRPADFLIFKN